MSDKIINLKDIILQGETALVGRKNGAEYREKLNSQGINFKDIEETYRRIIIVIPENIMSMNKSFFLAVWSDRVLDLGEERFKEKYVFQASEHIQHKIKKHIQAALLEATQEEILGVG